MQPRIKTTTIIAWILCVTRLINHDPAENALRLTGDLLWTLNAVARDEVELGKLTGELITAAGDAMQPQSISIWLKPSISRGRQQPKGIK
jgi:hypothetical protein